jgi:hypothetical protein
MARASKAAKAPPTPYEGALPDTEDFRDRRYVASLVNVPPRLPLKIYRKLAIPILDQGQERSCTGFGLATVAHYLLRRRPIDADKRPVSPRMLYEMAKRYDEFPGENYQGSTARGAMKGWHKHGVCSEALWPYIAGDDRCALTAARARDALRRPLGAYFRVDAKDLAEMHCAIAEVGILYVTAHVHDGWHEVSPQGFIPWSKDVIGAHAFAIVGYDEDGFWLQNSKGRTWGLDGFAHLSYEDWLTNAQDAWVARLGVPIRLQEEDGVAVGDGRGHQPQRFAALRPHVVSLGERGLPRRTGTYATSADDIATILGAEVPHVIAGWKRPRILLYAPSELAEENVVLRRLGDWRSELLRSEVYPLALLGEAGFLGRLSALLGPASDTAPPTPHNATTAAAKLRRAGGRALWQRLAEGGMLATAATAGGARLVAQLLAKLAAKRETLELHLLAHGTGALRLLPLLPFLTGAGKLTAPYEAATGLGCRIASLTLWAPLASVEQSKAMLLPALASAAIGRLTLFTLSPPAEEADTVAGLYPHSLAMLVANALGPSPHLPHHGGGEALLGIGRCIAGNATLKGLFVNAQVNRWVVAPGDGSAARHHDDFSTDSMTLQTTLARILKGKPFPARRRR